MSRYLFDKYHQRFSKTFVSERQRPPDRDETQVWLEHFLAQQVVITEAESLGYLERQEVKDAVSRMERYMLTAPNGPLLQSVATAPERSDEELQALFANSAKSLDGLFIRYPDEASLHAALGEDFTNQTLEQQTRRVQMLQELNDTAVVDGRLHWPFKPFSEIAVLLSTAEHGTWNFYRDRDFGAYAIFIRAASARPLGSFERSRDPFKLSIKHIDEQVAQRRFRIIQLKQAGLTTNDSVARRLVDFCETVEADPSSLPAIPNAALATSVLFRFQDGRDSIDVSVETFRRWLNDSIVRRFPRSEIHLHESVEDYVFESRSLALSRDEGLDSDSQFAEDRRGFASLQALDLYEREVLAPAVALDLDEISRYYSEHAAAFMQTIAVRGRMVTFRKLSDAAEWIRGRVKTGNAVRTQKPSIESDRELVLQRDLPATGWEGLKRQIMLSPDGTVFGPVLVGRSYQVFVKKENTSTGTLPLADVEDVIRIKLLREALDAKVNQLAVELVSRYRIEDYIDYDRLSLRMVEVRSPWRRRTTVQ